jgi:hypothetical protein
MLGSFAGNGETPSLTKDCTSREADWRFLLPEFTPERSVCFGGARLAAELACFSVTVRSAAVALVHQDCDLAATDAIDDATLRCMWLALRPGGACYLELPPSNRQPLHAVRRRLLAAGFADVRFYLARCTAPGGPQRTWVSLDRLSPSLFVTSDTVGGGRARRLARAVRRTLRFLTARAGRSGAVVVVGCKAVASVDGTAATDDQQARGEERSRRRCSLGVLNTVRSNWHLFGQGAAPERLSLLVTTPGRQHVNKVVAFVFDAKHSAPRLVVKLPRSASSVASLEREAAVLTLLQSRHPRLSGAPRPLFTHAYPGGVAVGQSFLPGTPLEHWLHRRTYRSLGLRVADWSAQLVDSPADAGNPHQGRIVAATHSDFERQFGAVVDPGMLRESFDRLAALGSLPRAFEQRDFSPWNILVRPEGTLGVVDWESAEPDGLPVLDLWYGLTYVAFYRSGAMQSGRYREAYRALIAPGTEAHATAGECMNRYLSATGVAPEVVRPLRLLVWMLHSRSEYREMSYQAGGAPSPQALASSLFVKLWEEEMAHEGD